MKLALNAWISFRSVGLWQYVWQMVSIWRGHIDIIWKMFLRVNRHESIWIWQIVSNGYGLIWKHKYELDGWSWKLHKRRFCIDIINAWINGYDNGSVYTTLRICSLACIALDSLRWVRIVLTLFTATWSVITTPPDD